MSTQQANAILTGTCAADRASDRIIGIVREILARRSAPPPARAILLDDDLRDVGLSSLDMVNLMLAVEGEFGLTIPEGEMTLSNFRSISAINTLIASLMKS
jgi:acyl carrier protein